MSTNAQLTNATGCDIKVQMVSELATVPFKGIEVFIHYRIVRVCDGTVVATFDSKQEALAAAKAMRQAK